MEPDSGGVMLADVSKPSGGKFTFRQNGTAGEPLQFQSTASIAGKIGLPTYLRRIGTGKRHGDCPPGGAFHICRIEVRWEVRTTMDAHWHHRSVPIQGSLAEHPDLLAIAAAINGGSDFCATFA